jgi:hypothetical protein
MDKYDVNKRLAACKVDLTTITAIFKPNLLVRDIQALEATMSEVGFWNDQLNAKQVSATAARKQEQHHERDPGDAEADGELPVRAVGHERRHRAAVRL